MDELTNFFRVFISLFTAAFTFFSGLFGGLKVSYDPIDAASIQLNAAIFSDVHLGTNDSVGTNLLTKGLKDYSRSSASHDAFVFTGDCTDDGNDTQFQSFFNILSSNNKASKTIVSMGNHDMWGDQTSLSAFEKYYSRYSGKLISTPYYTEEKNGYNFIVIGSEKMLKNEAYLSQTQLDWVDETLQRIAPTTKKPIFIIGHQPFNGTNRINESWSLGILGEQSEELMRIVKKYTTTGTTIIFCSGHLHSSLGYSGVTHDGNLYFVDCPSFGKTPERGDIRTTGTGYVLEAYVGRIILRGRDFVSGKFFEQYQYTIPTGEESTTVPVTTAPATQPQVTTTSPSVTTTVPIVTQPIEPID